MLNLNSLAASPCVISFFLVFFNATSRSLSTWVISSCPSCIPKAWGCQDDISTLLKDDILILLPQIPRFSRHVLRQVRLSGGNQIHKFRFEPSVNVRITCVSFGVVADAVIVMNRVVERHGGIGYIMAEPSHIKRDVGGEHLLDPFGILKCGNACEICL